MVKQKKQSRSYLRLSLAALLIIGVVCLLLIYHHRKQVSLMPAAQTSSKTATAQSNYTGGKSRPISSQNSVSQGGAIDEKGVAPTTTTDPSNWASSSSKAITLKQPIAGSQLNSGDPITGSATVNPIQYRLVDDANGVIAQGSLSVVSGVFSGKLQFKAYSSTGTLTVFSFDTQSGAEVNRIQIPVKLNP